MTTEREAVKILAELAMSGLGEDEIAQMDAVDLSILTANFICGMTFMQELPEYASALLGFVPGEMVMGIRELAHEAAAACPVEVEYVAV